MTGKQAKVALYARVSRDDLTCENQNIVLRTWAERNEVSPDRYELFNETMTTRKTRPVKEDVLKRFREGEFDTIVVSKLDRFARSNIELVMDVQRLVEAGGRFVSIGNSFDFRKGAFNSTQMLTLQIFGAFAEFERELIRERTLEGLARARAQGKKLGRPRKKPELVEQVAEQYAKKANEVLDNVTSEVDAD